VMVTLMSVKKGKASHYRPEQALRVPGVWGSQIWRQSVHEGGNFVSPTHWPPVPPENTPGTHFCERLESTPGPQCDLKDYVNDTIANRTRDLPACSAVPQPTAPPRTLMSVIPVSLHNKISGMQLTYNIITTLECKLELAEFENPTARWVKAWGLFNIRTETYRICDTI
jgi:hypothetical protein